MQLPQEVIVDFNKYLAGSQIMRMDPSKEAGKYTICDEESKVTFHDVEMAPPAGFFGVNYARCVQYSSTGAIPTKLLSDPSTMSHVPTGMLYHGPQHVNPNMLEMQGEIFLSLIMG